MTNGDKIREMTDEELVREVLACHIISCACPPDDMECQESCDQCWLDWLKAEAREET